ncbi:MAG: glycosyltransferase family 4 protein, partial [Kovacikia sp.]
MNVLHITLYDTDGAGRAAYRLHRGLKQLDIASKVFVQSKSSDDKTVITTKKLLGVVSSKLKLSERVDLLPLKLYSKRAKTTFSLQWVPRRILSDIHYYNPDVINLHWIGHGFVPIELLKRFNKPLVWTLHDMWAFTGGCHYSQDCDRYEKNCGQCPQLGSQSDWDLSRWVWERKARSWKNLDLSIVTPSKWLKQCADSSSLLKQFPVEVIPNGLDVEIYKPINRQLARSILNLPNDRQLLLFGASYGTNDPRKGFHLLEAALQKISNLLGDQTPEVVIFGMSEPDPLASVSLKTHYLGKLKDEVTLALAYSAADVFIAPSLQDNLPNTVMEALACGTPCVAFNIGGMPDLISHQQMGYLAKPYEVDDLAQGIRWVLEDSDRHHNLSQQAREAVVKSFTLRQQATAYLSLYYKVTEQLLD